MPPAQKNIPLAPGARVLIRGEEWMVNRVDRTSTGSQAISVTGLSELVRDKQFMFLDELDSPTAKRLAYDYREDRACPLTFGGAGIEGISGTIMVDGRTKDDDQRPAREFVLTRGMN